MGFSFSSLAVKGGSRESVLATLSLRATGTREEIPESAVTGATLPSGWYLITDNENYPAFAAEALKKVSTANEVLTCFVEEHVMSSAAAMWKDGREVWSVSHAAKHGIDHLETNGNLPPMFVSIRDDLRSKQAAAEAAATGKKPGVDFIFDVPVEMFAQLTRYRHDRVMPELGKEAFEVLVSTAPPPKRSWIGRLLGA